MNDIAFLDHKISKEASAQRKLKTIKGCIEPASALPIPLLLESLCLGLLIIFYLPVVTFVINKQTEFSCSTQFQSATLNVL